MTNILQKFLEWERTVPNDVFLRQPFGGTWKDCTFREAGEEIRRIAAGLKCLPPRSHVALLSKNCMHWVMADLAIMMSGHVSVPLYATLSSHSIRQILDQADVKAIIVGKLDTYTEQRQGIPAGVLKIGIGTYGIREEVQWEDWLTNAPLTEPHAWKADDVLTIIYTSGTTGKFKGVMHTVRSIDVVAHAGITDLSLPTRPSLFSFLPLSHTAERIGIETIGLYQGGQLSFAESLDTFADNLKDTQPHIFFAVPRIWTKFREKILEKMPQKKLDFLLSLPWIGSVVRRKIKNNLGLTRAERIYTGAAPISIELQQWFERLGIEILQAYGLSEDISSHFNRTGRNRHGTVGTPLSCFGTKIAADGEIRIKSDGNMVGYYNEPELTAAAFDEEHYLRTGDIGEVDAQGVLSITGRLKDQFKTDKGKYISPAPIELKFAANPDVDQVCMVGMGIPQPIALVVLSAVGKAKSKDALVKEITETVTAINAGIESYERIAKVVVMKSDWSIENGFLTPTLKIKRNEIEKMKSPRYAEWYAGSGTVVWE